MILDDVLRDRSTFEHSCDDRVEVTVRVLGDRIIYLDPKDTSITPNIVRDGYWESWVSLAIARHVRPGMVCVDAGANVGYFSLLMESRGARVIAIEPAPDTMRLLRRTVEENKLGDYVDLREVALGAMPGRAPLLRYGNIRGSDSLIRSPGYEVTSEVEVDVSPLDLVVGPRIVDFVKMDVESCEAEVWEGMKFARERNPDMVVCMEITVREDLDARGFLERLDTEKRLGVVEEDGSITMATPMGFLSHPMTVKHNYGTAWLS